VPEYDIATSIIARYVSRLYPDIFPAHNGAKTPITDELIDRIKTLKLKVPYNYTSTQQPKKVLKE
jgi:hypothetical protein